VGGSRRKRCLADGFDVTIRLLQHIVIPEAQDAEAFRLQPSVTASIPLRLCFRVLRAIRFDNELRSVAHEVHDVDANRLLASERKAFHLPGAQPRP
jgi:hypothetical protein